MYIRNIIKKSITSLIVLLASSATIAAEFPQRPVNMVVGYSAGGGVDTYARALAKVAPDYLEGQPIVVVNKPGGGGLIGGRFVADQPPTGYSLYLSSAGSMLLRNLSKRQVVSSNDFKAVATVGELTAGVFVPASSPIKDIPELLAYLKEDGKSARWGHTGRGNVWHVAGIGVLDKNNIKVRDVPFRGGASVRSALVSKQIDFGVIGAHLGLGFEQDVRLIGVLSDTRHPAVPDVSTAQEQNVDFVKVSSPIVVMAPKRVSDETIDVLSQRIAKMVEDTGYTDVLGKAGLPITSLGSTQSTLALNQAKQDWKPLVSK